MGLVNADVTPRPAPAESAALPDEVARESTLLGKWPIADVPLGASARVQDCMRCEDLVLIKRPVVIGRPRPIGIQLGTERPAGHSSLKTSNFFKCFWQLYSQPIGVFLSALRVC